MGDLECSEVMCPLQLTEQEKIDRAEAAPKLPPLVPATPESPEPQAKRQRSLPSWFYERRDTKEESSEEETEDLKNRLQYIKNSLEDRCSLRTQEGRDALCEFNSPHSSQFSDFSLSQLSSSSQVSSDELRAFIETHVAGARFSEIEKDPLALLECLNIALDKAFPEPRKEPTEPSKADELQALVYFIHEVKRNCLVRVKHCEEWMTRMIQYFLKLYYPGSRQLLVDHLYTDLLNIDSSRKKDCGDIDDINDRLHDILNNLGKDEVDHNILKEAMNQYNITESTSWYTLNLTVTMRRFYSDFEEMITKNVQKRIKEAPFDSVVDEALRNCSEEQVEAFGEAVNLNTIEFLINEEWPRHKSVLVMQSERLFEDCVEACGLINADTAFMMTEQALQADLESASQLQVKVKKVLADSEWIKGLVLHRISAMAQQPKPNWVEVGEETDKYAELSSALSVNKVKLEKALLLLDKIKEAIQFEQDKRKYRTDNSETQEDPGDVIFDPFFCLDANPEVLQSFFNHSHAEMLRKIFEAEGSQDPAPDTTGCPASGGAGGPSQGDYDDLEWNIRLIRSAPALLPRI